MGEVYTPFDDAQGDGAYVMIDKNFIMTIILIWVIE